MGFREDIHAIAKLIKPSPERQTFMFSATLSTAIQQVAKTVLAKDHSFINCVPDDAAPTHLQIPQYYTAVPTPEEQLPYIVRLLAEDQLANPGKSKVLVFLPTTRMVKLYSTLIERVGVDVLPAGLRTRFYEIHSQKNMQSRVKTSDTFRKDVSGTAVMFTSDVSARGVDYPGVTRVIQVGTPASGDIYVHRVGRTGRGSNMTGRADLVLLPWELGFLSWQLTDIPIKELPMNEQAGRLAELAKKYDADPEQFFPALNNGLPARGAPRTAAERYQRMGFQSNVAERLEQISDRVVQLQPMMDEEDVQSAMSTMLAFYASNASTLRVQRNVTVAGVNDWAQALLGRSVQLRLPREFGQRERRSVSYKRSDSDQRRSFDRDSERGRGGADSRRGWSRDSESYGRRDPDARRSRDYDSDSSREFNNSGGERKSFTHAKPMNRWEGRGSFKSRSQGGW